MRIYVVGKYAAGERSCFFFVYFLWCNVIGVTSSIHCQSVATQCVF